MHKLRIAAGLAAGLMALSGCGDATRDTSVDGLGVAPGNGGTAGDGTGGQTAGETTGGTIGNTGGAGNTTGGVGSTTGGDTGGDDGGADGATGGDCIDDPTTVGNDCPGVVSCTDAVDSCSTAAQSCCVKDYKTDAVSCNDGSTCDGLATAECDGPEDCTGGKVCCISVSIIPSTDVKLSCVDAAACSGGQIISTRLCHSDEECEGNGSKTSCVPIGTFPWWGYCN